MGSTIQSSHQLLARIRGEQILETEAGRQPKGKPPTTVPKLTTPRHPFEEIPNYSCQDPLIGLSKFGWMIQ